MSALMEYLTKAVQAHASDLFFIPGASPCYKQGSRIIPLDALRMSPETTDLLIRDIYALSARSMDSFLDSGDDDFSFSVAGMARFRVNTYRQRGTLAAVIRIVSFTIPNYQSMSIPEQVMQLSTLSSGMVLFTGTAGCGKSTTLACLVDRINRERTCHIITLEDPIEYLHRNQSSLVSQREINMDTKDYLSALRACLRQAPDVIQLGEMRDPETVRTAITAAETGHLLLATLHTRGAVNAIDRVIDTFPANQQSQIRSQLTGVLRTVVSQQLLPDVDGGQVPAFEILHMTDAIANMIRESKNHQIASAITSGSSHGMISMDQSIFHLYKEGRITRQTALDHADNPELLLRRMTN